MVPELGGFGADLSAPIFCLGLLRALQHKARTEKLFEILSIRLSHLRRTRLYKYGAYFVDPHDQSESLW